MNSISPYVGRLAPSPTGAQHVGNARTYLIAWLAARRAGGRLVLRIEDIDSPRIKAGAAEQALSDLRWLGLDWDGDPLVQTRRLAHYENVLADFRQRELVYPCTCTRADVAAAASAPHLEHEGPAYPGTCSGRRASDADTLDQPYSWRFRVHDSPAFVDGLYGEVRIDIREIGGDFVVWKSAGTPAYQLTVVVDDIAQEVTEVVRGDDLLASTPRQILLYQALGRIPPRFTHVPLVVGTDGRRLAKRHGDTRLSSLRENGVTAESLLGLLAWSCGWIAEAVPFTAANLIPLFRTGSIPKVPFVLTAEFLSRIGYLTR
jgi:glutamyl-tRNA synthetase